MSQRSYRQRVRVLLLRVFLLCFFTCCSGIAYGQSGRPGSDNPDGKDTDEVVRVRTDEVLLPVSVRDLKGQPVEGLTAESFLIYDNGVRQQITSFNRRRTPANIVLLLDASTSVFRQM